MDEKNTNLDQNKQPTTPGTNEAATTAPEAQTTSDATETTTPEATAATAQPEGATAAPAKTPWTFIVIVLVVIALLAGGVWWLSQNGTDRVNELGTGAGTPGAETAAPSFSADEYPDVVAVVNGVDVSSERFVQGLEQAAQQAAQQGVSADDEEVRSQIETQTATALVNTELLIQAAAEAGVAADQEAIDAEIAVFVEQFGSEEAFQEQLDAAGLTLEELQADFEENLTIEAYIRQTPEWGEVSIAEGEAQAFYDNIASQNPDQEVPPFAEVESAIEEQLLGTKQQEVTQVIIDRLRTEADIEVMIE